MATRIEVDRDVRRFNCANCGSVVWPTENIPVDDVDTAAVDITCDCPRCASVWAVAGAGYDTIIWELAVRQNEYDRVAPSKGAFKRPKRDAIYSDPVFGPIRRAMDREAAAERDRLEWMGAAHYVSGKSVREIATTCNLSVTTCHRMLRKAAETFDYSTPVATHTTINATDDIPF